MQVAELFDKPCSIPKYLICGKAYPLMDKNEKTKTVKYIKRINLLLKSVKFNNRFAQESLNQN